MDSKCFTTILIKNHPLCCLCYMSPVKITIYYLWDRMEKSIQVSAHYYHWIYGFILFVIFLFFCVWNEFMLYKRPPQPHPNIPVWITTWRLVTDVLQTNIRIVWRSFPEIPFLEPPISHTRQDLKMRALQTCSFYTEVK